MRSVINLFLAILLISAVSSCEKVIDVNLNSVQKKYVIEGVITDQSNSCKVVITQTKDFDEDNNFAGISGAKVTITDDAGTVTNIIETQQGVYVSSLKGIPGKTYNLSVTINGETFSASSKMPTRVNLDSIYTTEITFFGKTSKYINVKLKDPAGLGNNYRFIKTVNSIKATDIYVYNDDLSDGREITATLFGQDDDIKKGDTIKVDIQCIDAEVYKYWFSLSQSSLGENQSASPANPVSNITGGALGYFSAQTVQSKSLVVQ